jgi:glyceraldehyde-3-phosphate dehydrogenase/erythrose-4-phosphate dehydrogenase
VRHDGRVAINDLGRIGRLVLRALHEARCENVEVVAINNLGPVATNHIPAIASCGLEALTRSCCAEVDDVVEQQMPLLEGIVLTGKPDRAATVLGRKIRCGL